MMVKLREYFWHASPTINGRGWWPKTSKQKPPYFVNWTGRENE